MSFVLTDAEKHEVIDIVENRQLHFLKNYFYHYSLKARRSVKTITIDICSPYMTLIEELFPNAEIIIDKFHIVQLLSRELNKKRIEVMKTFSTKSMEYK